MTEINLQTITQDIPENESPYASIHGIKINCFSDLSVHGGKLQQ